MKRTLLTLSTVLALAAILATLTHAQLAPPTTRPTYSRPARIVAVWEAQISDFPKWKALGVNTLISFDQSANPAQWMAAAQAAGLYYVREPLPTDTAVACIADPYLLAFLHKPDEPDAVGTPPATLQAEYDARKSWGIPWAVDFSGGYLLGIQGKVSAQTYAAYCAASDWVCADMYPASAWGIPIEGGVNGGISLLSPAQCSDRLSSLKPGAPQIIILETSRQGLAWLPGGGRAPTPNESWAEAGPLIARPGVGIGWFTCSFNPFAYDATTTEQKQRMAAITRTMVRQGQ